MAVIPLLCIVALSEVAPFSVTLTALVTGVAVLTLWDPPHGRRSCMWDVASGLVVVAAIFSYAVSQYRPTSLLSVLAILESVLLYHLVRSIRLDFTQNFLNAVNLVNSTVALSSLSTFASRYGSWRVLGFSDLTLFKRQVQLFSIPSYSGARSLYFLISVIFALTSRRSVKGVYGQILLVTAIALNASCCLLSFQRGMYIALLPLLVVEFYRVRQPLRDASMSSEKPILLTTTLLVALWFPQPVLRTVEIYQNVSQVRSAKGRNEMVFDGINIFKSRPLTGVGIGNFTHADRGDRRDNPDRYSPAAFNSLVELIAEQGLIGIAIAALVAALVLPSLKRDVSGRALEDIAAFGAIFIFLLTQSAITEHRRICDLAAIWMSFRANEKCG
ncbi:O-antigen ligase family protein [Terriglobus sp. ADX1]|uniref:O-antigen ligase family protein n=1 Tax=Terriglobus sp. ADX1 TaxID=2794063 RepID=UPI002FE6C499